MSGRTQVAYLGPDGTFASEAVRRLRLLPEVEAVPLSRVTDVVDAVDSGLFEYGLVPFENSVEGVVTPTLDRLVFVAEHVRALEEVVLPVSFTAWVSPAYAAHPGPWSVASHPHALAQCSGFTDDAGERVETTSTAEACALAAKAERPVLALAGPTTGELFGLTAHQTGVEDHPGAATRFLLLGHAQGALASGASGGQQWPTSNQDEEASSTLLVLTPPSDRTGVLKDLLDVFARRDLGLSALVVRPLRGALGLYTFVLTITGHLSSPAMREAITELAQTGHAVKLLGSYLQSADRLAVAASPDLPAGSSTGDAVTALLA